MDDGRLILYKHLLDIIQTPRTGDLLIAEHVVELWQVAPLKATSCWFPVCILCLNGVENVLVNKGLIFNHSLYTPIDNYRKR